MRLNIRIGLLAVVAALMLGACGDPPTVSGPQGAANAEGGKKPVSSETGDRG